MSEINVIQFPTTLDAKAERIRTLAKQTIDNVIEIGKLLTECQTEIKLSKGHGHWLPWLEHEFNWHRMTADRFMRVYDAKDKLNKLFNFDLDVSACYLLTAPENADIRDEVIEEVAQEAKVTQKRITHKSVKRKVRETRARKPKPSKPARSMRPSKPVTAAKPSSNWRTGVDIVDKELWETFSQHARNSGQSATVRIHELMRDDIGHLPMVSRPTSRSDAPVKTVKRDLKGPRYLTPEEVDPEFTGTPMEFTAKYGHVQIHTAEQFATMRFGDWSQFVRSLEKLARKMPGLRNVDHNWLRSPEPNAVTKLAEALNYLRPIVSEAEALLKTATEALKKKEGKTDDSKTDGA